jgi:hypothetical protein
MSVDHLQGRRTGRPRGSKSKSPALKGLIWAARHLGKNAEAPTDAARYWQNLAKDQPNKFVAALAELDAATRRPPAEQKNGESAASPHLSPDELQVVGTWAGSEKRRPGDTANHFYAFPNVQFEFRVDGTALIVDVFGTFDGTWSLAEDQVTIDRPGVRYHGIIHDTMIKGDGIANGKDWKFQVEKK